MKDTITALQQARAAANARIQALAAIEAANGDLTEAQLQEFTSAKAEFDTLQAKIERLQAAERTAAATAAPLSDVAAATVAAAATSGGTGVHVQPAFRSAAVPGAGVARMARAMAASKGDPRRAAEYAERHGFGEDVSAALNMGSESAGGVLIPENLASEVIELLRPKAVVRRLGARTLPLPNGNMTVPRLKGGAIVGYIGSDTDIPATQETFDDLKLTAKKLAALVPISNDLLNYSGTNQNVDQIVVGDLTGAVAAREDKAFIRDDGTGNTPKGLRSWALAANTIHAPDISQLSGQALYNAVDQFLGAMILLLENSDCFMYVPGWIMAPRTKRFLADFRDGNGNKFYPELDQGMLKGYPVGSTTQVPNNLGAKSNQSEIYFADFGDCFIGDNEQLRIDYSSEATYKDSDGNVVSAFQRDQTLVRVITTNDFGPRHVESIAVADQVTWGAAA